MRAFVSTAGAVFAAGMLALVASCAEEELPPRGRPGPFLPGSGGNPGGADGGGADGGADGGGPSNRDGGFLFVATTTHVHSFSIDAVSGALTALGAVDAGESAYGMAYAAATRTLYVAGSVDSALLTFGVGADGRLSRLASTPAGTNPSDVVVDATGRFLFVSNFGSNDVSRFALDGGLPVPLGSVASSGTGPNALALHPNGRHLYTADFLSNTVSIFSVDGGTLSANGSIAVGTSPNDVAVHPGGSVAYVTNAGSGDVSVLSVDFASGALTPGTSGGGSNGMSGLAVDPGGDFLFATSSTGDALHTYRVASGPALADAGVYDARTSESAVAIDPSARFVFVTNLASDDVTVFRFDRATGGLTELGSFDAGSAPGHVLAIP